MISLDHKNDRCQAPYGLLRVAGVTCFFSYDTIVAAYISGNLYYVQNSWGPTTGKHMNKMFNRSNGTECTEAELQQHIAGQLITNSLEHLRDRMVHNKESTYG